jgi:ABC-type glycerol-3-phosphate transport system substrate-binding protein
MKKIISMVLCMAFALSLLSGCGGKSGNTANSSTTTNTQKPVTIKIGIWPQDTDEAGLKTWEAYKQKMAAKYPYITLQPESYNYAPETFIPKAESGQVPNIFSTWYTEPNKLIANGYVADITDIAKKYGYDTAINPDVLKLVSKDGKIYGIPRDGYALGLYINMNLFKQAGLVDDKGLPKYPRTFDELAQTAKIIKDKTGKAGMFFPTKDHVGGWHFVALAWSFGAEFEKQVNGKWVSGLDSPEAIAALQYVKDLKWKYDVLLPSALLSWGDWIKNFGTDQVGMTFAAPDALRNPVNDYKMSKDAIAMAPIPQGPKGQFSLMGGSTFMFAANNTPEQTDACFKLIDVIGRGTSVDPDSMAAFDSELKDQNSKNYPVGPKPIAIWSDKTRLAAEDAIYKKYTNVNMDLFKPYYDTAFKGLKPEEPYNTQDLYGLLDTCLQVVITDKNADPKALLENASKEFQTKFLDKAK